MDSKEEMKMNLDDLTLGQLREIQALLGNKVPQSTLVAKEEHPYTLGKRWFFRTVTHHLLGEVKSVGKQEIILRGGTVMWIADDGRLTEFLKKGIVGETEVYGESDVIIGRGSIIDASEYSPEMSVSQR